MAAIVESIEISRRAEDVFSYVIDFSRFPEWQDDVVSVRADGQTPPAVGSEALVTRRVGPRQLAATEKITRLNPPRSWTVRAVGGPLVAIAEGVIEPLEGGEKSRVTIALDFQAHGTGRLLLPLVVRRQARKHLAQHTQKLKQVLEH